MAYAPDCSLCQKDKLAPQPYADDVCWETVCLRHQQPMLVLNRHAYEPTSEEMAHIEEVRKERHPDKQFRGYMQSTPQHWHDHLV